MTLHYEFDDIQALLMEVFTDEGIRCFCYDIPDFRPIYDRLNQNHTKVQIVELLLKEAALTSQIESLLTLIKEYSPILYKIPQPYSSDTRNPASQKQNRYDREEIKRRFIVEGFECYENFMDKHHKFQLVAAKKNTVVIIVEFTNLDGVMDEFIVRAFVQSCWQYVSSKSNDEFMFCLPCMVVNLTDIKAISRLREIARNEAEKIKGPRDGIRYLINTMNPFKRNNFIISPIIYSTKSSLVPISIHNIGWILSGEELSTTISKRVMEKNRRWLENNSNTEFEG